MCTPEFFGYGTQPEMLAGGAPGIADPAQRRNVNPFIQRPAPPKGTAKQMREQKESGTGGDFRALRRAGLSSQDAKQLAEFANFRGGLDAFENIAAARAAFAKSGAFTERALVPKEAEQVSRFGGGTVNTQKVGASELRGLPLIRRG